MGNLALALNSINLRKQRMSVDILLSAIAALVVIPAFLWARLPVRIDVIGMGTAYWGGTAVRSMFVAIVLSVAGLPLRETVVPLVTRYWKEKPRFLALSVLSVWMFWIFGFWFGLAVVVDAIALAELLDRRKDQFASALGDIFVPSAFLFAGLLLVFSFNHAIAGIKYAGSFDSAFNRLDVAIFRTNVTSVSHWLISHVPIGFFRVMEFAYYSLYGQIGAGIAITALLAGRRYALRYVGTLLIGYYIALVLFFLMPTIGPFAICPQHTTTYPHELATYWTQETILVKAKLLWQRNLIPEIIPVNVADYYIGFPCMHVGLPLILIWYLRKWPRIATILICFDVLLVMSIVALEWHYLVDLFGGVFVAWAAIKIRTRFDSRSGHQSAGGTRERVVKSYAFVGENL